MKKRSFCLFLNLDLFDKVKERAKEKNMSMTCYIVQAILAYFERD